MAVGITEETSSGQVDSHSVLCLQVEDHNNSGTVLLVVSVSVCGPGHRLAVNLQTGAGCQGVIRSTSVAVDGEGDAVDARVGNSEDAGRCIVSTTQVKEDMFVGDEAVDNEGAETLEILIV